MFLMCSGVFSSKPSSPSSDSLSSPSSTISKPIAASDYATVPVRPTGLTYEAYRKIQDGMFPCEVSLLLNNFNEIEQSSTGNLKMIAWKDGARTVICTFEDNKLISKVQAGLE